MASDTKKQSIFFVVFSDTNYTWNAYSFTTGSCADFRLVDQVCNFSNVVVAFFCLFDVFLFSHVFFCSGHSKQFA
jgi:hypothetical protein